MNEKIQKKRRVFGPNKKWTRERSLIAYFCYRIHVSIANREKIARKLGIEPSSLDTKIQQFKSKRNNVDAYKEKSTKIEREIFKSESMKSDSYCTAEIIHFLENEYTIEKSDDEESDLADLDADVIDFKPLHRYMDSKAEESALNSLCMFLKIPEKIFFESTEHLLKNKHHFLPSHKKYDRPAGFGAKKLNNISEVYKRVVTNADIENLNYHSDYKYGFTLERYEGLAVRSFDRIVFEQFHTRVFFSIFKGWKEPISKSYLREIETKVDEIVSAVEFTPDQSWLCYELSNENQVEIKKIYGDMKVVRFRNILMEVWDKINKKILNKLFKNYLKEGHFGKMLPASEFIQFFGSNDSFRKCTYCDISESDVSNLVSLNRIYTKRIYSRGTTMEIDKRDPRKPYESGNLIMSCYWCNNAKTDEFDEEEFGLIAKVIGGIWKKRIGVVT